MHVPSRGPGGIRSGPFLKRGCERSTLLASEKTRVIVTTDMEVDDMNSTIHLALYLNLLDVEAIVYTSSQYHFQGDGVHTLAEANPNWRTKGVRSYEGEKIFGPDPNAGSLTSYRPFPEGWIERLWDVEYREAYPFLAANAKAAGEPAFPTPDEMIDRTHVGNIAFEGDVREETAGSKVIERAILDDDPRTLWLLSWGGMNTIVRALMSIAERYEDTPQWDEVRARVYGKVRVMGVMDGVGQDNSWLDHGAKHFPELIFWRAPFAYGGYVDAKFAQPDSIELFRAPWPEQMLTSGNGPLMERYMLYGDGKHYEGEPEKYQFGEHATLDWGIPGMGALVFDAGDFMAEGDSMTYIPLLPFGLRGADDPRFDTLVGRLFPDGSEAPAGAPSFASMGDMMKQPADNPNPFLRSYQEDFAARAAWCAHEPSECNHAPQIAEVTPDTQAAPGETLRLHASASDPDGDELSCRWTLYGERGAVLWQEQGPAASFTVPASAKAGDSYVVTLAVQDAAERPMTRYAQVLITIG